MARRKADMPKPAASIQNTVIDSISKREKIELLAYSYWVQRGRQGGSPEEDWFRAEREINQNRNAPLFSRK